MPDSQHSSTRFQKIRLLLWKNLLWHRYYWWWTILEILSRSLISIYISFSLVQSNLHKPIMKPQTLTPVRSRAELIQTVFLEYRYFTYTPSTPFTDKLLQNVIKALNTVNKSRTIELVKMVNEEEMIEYTIKRSATKKEQPLGIVFLEIASNDSNVPSKLIYKLRFKHYALPKVNNQHNYFKPGPYQSIHNLKNPEGESFFWYNGVSAIQLLVNEEFVRMKADSTTWSTPQVSFQIFPYPAYDGSRTTRDQVLILFGVILITFETILAVPLLASVVNEKQNGSKELMKIYGVQEWMIWLCWFVKAFIIAFLSITLMTTILYIPWKGPHSEVMNYVTFPVSWLAFLLYGTANISFILFMGAIFNQANIACLVFMFLIYFLYIAIYIIGQIEHADMFLLMFPMANLIVETLLFRAVEVHRVNGTLASTNTFRQAETTLTHIDIYLTTGFNIIFYSILAILINMGIYSKLKSRFPIFKGLSSRHQEHERHEIHEESLQKVHHSVTDQINKRTNTLVWKIDEPKSDNETGASSRSGHEPLLRVEDLHSQYGVTQVLKGVDAEFHEHELNVILGHRGAGKSTLFSILTGSIPFTHGKIYYKGTEISSHLNVLKNNVSRGFKMDALFNHLSVRQHLQFYGMLKGLSKNDVNKQSEYLINKLAMQKETSLPVVKLPTSVKKKLSIAATLIGEREILLLDEPMVGLDVESKIEVWNLLADMRSHRTIVLSSNYETAAEKLADRITVLENGAVIAHGTRDFFKKNIGNDYEVLISGKNMNSSEVSDTVHNNVNATVERETEHDIVYKVPLSESHKFHRFFGNLENSIHTLGISTVHVTFNTIQHILIKNGSLSGHHSVVSSHTAEILHGDPTSSTGGLLLRLRQIWILFKKRTLCLARDYVNILLRIIIPTFIVLFLTRIVEIFDLTPYPLIKLSPSTLINPKFKIHNKTSSQGVKKLYEGYIKSQGATAYSSTKSNIIEDLISYGDKNILNFRKELIAAFETDTTKTSKILYNLWLKYSLSIAITTYSNVLLKNSTKDQSSEIITYSHPIPFLSIRFKTPDCMTIEMEMRLSLYFIALFFLFGYLSNEVILYLFQFTNREYSNGLKHLQLISGVPKWIYWFTTFVFDLLFFCLVVAFRVALFMLFDNFIGFFKLDLEFGIFILLLIINAITGLFCTYIVSQLYKPTRDTYAHLFLFNMACNIAGVMLIFMRHEILFPGVITSSSPLIYIISYLPFLNYIDTMQTFFVAWSRNNYCFISCPSIAKQFCKGKSLIETYAGYEKLTDEGGGLQREFTHLIVTLIYTGVIFILTIIGIADFLNNVFKKSKPQHQPDDENVLEERQEIQSAKEDESRYHQVPLMVDGLNKNYFKWFKPKTAVDNVSFMTQHETCFGILGTHHSGKTTAIGMMANRITPTKGNVSIEGVELRKNKKQYLTLIGYCPQTSPLLDKFTGREMLMLIASLKGIEGNTGAVVDELISSTGLEGIQNHKCESYTDGDKRILGTTLSLIGNPKVIFLDEPTSDIDSLSKRHIYDIVEQVKHSGKIVVIGTKSPTECEILCDRTTMLMNGVMFCIGNPQDLKHQFNLGYFVLIKIHSDAKYFKEVVHLERNMIDIFGSESCRLLEEYKGLVHYLITDHSLPLSTLFQRMENIKERNSIIEEYTVSTSTLENIYDSLTISKELFRSASFY